MLRSSPLRVLGDRDVPDALALLAHHPVENVFPSSRLQTAGADPWRLGAEVWGYYRDGELAAICHAGANLVPAEADDAAARAFATRARRQGRRCSSIVGDRSAVAEMWRVLAPHWGPARDVRHNQPLLAIDAGPLVAPDPLVRRVRPEELDTILPACIAMFTEEVGVSPVSGDGGALYRSRVAELVAAGRSFARIENGEVVFKAEVGSATAAACQVQGVWVAPAYRGQGIGTAGTAAVVALAMADIAPVVSLYVNDYNVPARTAYDRVGFVQVGAFMSVLF